MTTPLRSRPSAYAALLLTGTLALTGCAATSDATPSAQPVEVGEDPAEAPAKPAEPAGPAGTTYPVTISDCGEDEVFDTAPERIATVGSDAIALLDAAGAADRIVARSGEFGAELPVGLTAPPTDAEVLDDFDPTTEQLIGSGADVVIGYGFFQADPVALADAGIRTLTVTGECGHDGGAGVQGVTYDVVLSDIERFGELFDTTATAETAVAELRERLDAVAADRPDTARTAAVAYYFSSSSSISSYGGTGIIQSMMAEAGLENVYGDEPKTYLEISLESLLDADPEVIVLAYGLHGDTYEEARARFLAEPGVDQMQAVAADRIIGIPANESSASPAAVAGLERLQGAVAELD